MKLIVLVGPPGCGKTTRAKQLESKGFIRVNQDDQGKFEHLQIFEKSLAAGKDIVVDRMNFNRQQRSAYMTPAKRLGYETEIVVLHESYETCSQRCGNRNGHPTIKTVEDSHKALQFFFKNYERVEDSEADVIERVWPEQYKLRKIICDLDGTMYDIDHRLHWVRNGQKNWPMFFAGIKNDIVNPWCKLLLGGIQDISTIDYVYCSGRGEEYRKPTEEKLQSDGMSAEVFMRLAGDHRPDYIVKEVILEFEILTRYEPYLFIDDRPSVCRMWRKHGYTVLQCNDKEF